LRPHCSQALTATPPNPEDDPGRRDED